MWTGSLDHVNLRLLISTACEEIYNCCLNAATDTSPQIDCNGNNRTRVAGWNDHVLKATS
jgi:hypothetical protein